jgi:hypothetical protein
MTKLHELKCEAQFFDEIVTGRKPFDLRKNDRHFQTGDMVKLIRGFSDRNEWRVDADALPWFADITYILEQYAGLNNGYCILGLRGLDEAANQKVQQAPVADLSNMSNAARALRDELRVRMSDAEIEAGLAQFVPSGPDVEALKRGETPQWIGKTFWDDICSGGNFVPWHELPLGERVRLTLALQRIFYAGAFWQAGNTMDQTRSMH